MSRPIHVVRFHGENYVGFNAMILRAGAIANALAAAAR